MLIMGLIKRGKFLFNVLVVYCIVILVVNCVKIWGWRKVGKWGKLNSVFVFSVANWCKTFWIFVRRRSVIKVRLIVVECLDKNFNKIDSWYLDCSENLLSSVCYWEKVWSIVYKFWESRFVLVVKVFAVLNK